MKQYNNAMTAEPEQFANSEQRKQLFDVDIEGVPYFNRRLGKPESSLADSTIYASSKQILKRILQIKG